MKVVKFKQARNWALLGSLCLALIGCQTGQKTEKTEKGAVAGAVVGGVVGAAKGGAKGAVAGAAAGGATGAAVGAYLDKRANELAKVVETKKTEQGLLVTLKNDILFDFDKATLRDPAKETLSELANILVKYPEDQIRIAGYTDYIGPADYNQQLSEQRAEAVKDYLVSQGVDAGRLDAVGMGEDPNQATTSRGRQQNRRVELFIDPKLPTEQAAR